MTSRKELDKIQNIIVSCPLLAADIFLWTTYTYEPYSITYNTALLELKSISS